MCPACNARVDADASEVGGNNFCERCDEPLFWRTPSSVPADDSVGGLAAHRPLNDQGVDGLWTHDRLPDLHGRQSNGSELCWNCGEPNDPPLLGGFVSCRLCSSTIPKPIEPTPALAVEVGCVSKEGVSARRSWEVPDKLLVAVGAVLVLVTVALIVQLATR